MIEALKDRPYASISLKPTSLGINESEAYCQANLRRIVEAAAAHRIHITLDMEERHFTDVTLRMFRAIREEFDNFGIVLQSRLSGLLGTSRRCLPSAARCASASASTTSPPMWPSQDKADMKDKLFEYMQMLLDQDTIPRSPPTTNPSSGAASSTWTSAACRRMPTNSRCSWACPGPKSSRKS